MEKYIVRWGFIAGLVCAAIAVIWRAANAFGLYAGSIAPGITVYYGSFFKAAFLFLLLSIAAAQVAAASKNA